MSKSTNINKPYIVGLTGGIGSGKTTIANLFISKGICAVDADIVAREIVTLGTPALTAIAEHFGAEIITDQGELNRSKLREVIFSQPSEKQWLNNLLHPLIRQEIFRQISQATSPYCLLIAPLLFENNLHTEVDRTLAIDVDEATQIARTSQRDNCSAELVKNIIASQISRAERLALSDDVLNNQARPLEQVAQDISKFDDKYRQLALKKEKSVKKSLKMSI